MNEPRTDWKETIEPGEDEILLRHAETLRDLQRKAAKKDGVGRALWAGDDVEGPDRAVQEKHVSVARATEHHLRTGGAQPAAAVRGEVFWAAVCLGLDDLGGCNRLARDGADEDATDEALGQVDDRLVEERPGHRLQVGESSHVGRRHASMPSRFSR